MSIKKLNESIDNLLNEVEVSQVGIKPTFEEELRKSLKETLDYCIRNDRSLYGIADSFADRIESMVPDKRWWEVTDCDFYTEMFNTGDYNSVINCIIDELKPEYKQNVNESYNPEPDEVTDFKKAVDSADTIDDIQFLIYELSDGVAEDACQVAFDNAVNSDADDIDTVKDEVISAIDIYLEDNEFNEAYQKLDESSDIDDELDHPEQEFDSAKTSINSNKLPAVYRMLSIPKGSVGVDFGGGSFDNAVEHISDLGATLYVYDPYNRSAEHNRQVIKSLRENGGADWAINSNVLNVIKEPEARRAVLENISKITKPNAPIYITVYEGRGDRKEGPTKSGYQLNRKTQDYLEEIQKVFPDAKRKGKLITAHNTKSSTSSINENSENTLSDGYVIESTHDYGGAYDIDPSQYFIKADINGFAEDVVNAINARSYPRVNLVSTYLENNKIKVTVEWDGNEATASEKIDMRKIHNPNDIDKYSKPIANELIRQLKKFGFYVGSQSHNEGYLNGSYNPKNKESVSKRLQEDAEETQYYVGDKETGSIYNSYDDAKRAYDYLKSRGIDAVMEPVEDISLHEDTIKTKDDKWVNKGTEGTHGKFRTKKQADAQRKAMFANGFKGENYQTKLKFEAIRPDSDLVKYQQWVDYDMKHDGKISSETKRLIRKAGLQVVKDKYGDYKVIHTVSDIRGILSQYPDISIYTKDELGGDYKYYTLIKSREDALKYNYQPDFWGTADEYQKDNVKFVSELEPYIGKHVLAFDDDTVFILLGVLIDNQYNSLDHTKVLVEKVGNDKVNESIDTPENKESVNKNTLSEEYDEPELLGKGYAAPTSMDYVSNIKRLVKYKVTDFIDIQNLMQKTMDNIDAFDDYWKVHKAAIMKNIKEAQDLIPTEYRI